MTRFLAALLLIAAPAAAQTITTHGPGDGCAPYLDGTVNPGCLAVDVLRSTSIDTPTRIPAHWEAAEFGWIAPGATPLDALLPLIDQPFGEEGAADLQIHMGEWGDAVDFVIRVTGWAGDSVAGADLAGRLVRDANGLWTLIQLDRRYLCRRGVGDSGLCT